MNWDFVVLSLIYFRTASILLDLKNLNLSKHFERLTGWKDSLFNRNSFDLTKCLKFKLFQDHIASLIARKGPGCLIYKCDLRKAYRQFYVDPFDFPLMGFQWNNCYYFDVVLPMGLRSAAMACQRITSAISYICSRRGFDVVNYLVYKVLKYPTQPQRHFVSCNLYWLSWALTSPRVKLVLLLRARPV